MDERERVWIIPKLFSCWEKKGKKRKKVEEDRKGKEQLQRIRKHLLHAHQLEG